MAALPHLSRSVELHSDAHTEAVRLAFLRDHRISCVANELQIIQVDSVT